MLCPAATSRPSLGSLPWPSQEFPSLILPLLTERDQYMTFMLRKLASRAHTVVAVVGAGHLQGIRWGPGLAAARPGVLLLLGF